VDRALAVPDEHLRQRAEAAEAAVHAIDQVGRLPGEHERAGERARPAELGGHDVAAPRLAVADRDLDPRLEEVKLHQLAGPVGGALVGAPPLVERPGLGQVVVEDRPAAVVAERLDQLADALAGQPRIVLQQTVDLALEGVELRRPRRALVARQALAPQRAADGVAVVAGAPNDLVDRKPINLLHPPDLRPAPHVEHCLPPRRSHDLARVRFTPDETDLPLRRVRFRFSSIERGGAGGPVQAHARSTRCRKPSKVGSL
jgi:hypothetical protein